MRGFTHYHPKSEISDDGDLMRLKNPESLFRSDSGFFADSRPPSLSVVLRATATKKAPLRGQAVREKKETKRGKLKHLSKILQGRAARSGEKSYQTYGNTWDGKKDVPCGNGNCLQHLRYP